MRAAREVEGWVLMAGSRKSGAHSEAKRWALVAAIIAFVLVDIGLVFAALSSSSAPESERTARSADYWSETWGERPSPSPAAPQPVQVPAVAPARILEALDGEIAWRATTGACPDAGATPEVTTDGGASWKTTDATRPTGVTALRSIEVTSESFASFIGLSGDDCAPQYVRTYVGGDNYASYNEELADEWYLASDGGIHAPGGNIAAPCETVVSLAPRGADAAGALCADSTVHLTSDRGASWAPAPPLGSPVAVASADGGYVAAMAGAIECEGVQVTLLTDIGEPASSGCYPLAVEPAALSGNVALSASQGVIWLWAADALAKSTDNGATWS